MYCIKKRKCLDKNLIKDNNKCNTKKLCLT